MLSSRGSTIPQSPPWQGSDFIQLIYYCINNQRASERNRNVILCLEGRRTNHCATLAFTKDNPDMNVRI